MVRIPPISMIFFLTGAQNEEPDNPPDLVISGTNLHQSLRGLITPSFQADTVVLSRDPAAHSTIESQGWLGKILEKPGTKEENLRMLLELNARSCEVVTGVSVRTFAHRPCTPYAISKKLHFQCILSFPYLDSRPSEDIPSRP